MIILIKLCFLQKKDYQSRDQAAKPKRKKGKCFNCGLDGHWAKECRKPKKNKKFEKKPEYAHASSSSSCVPNEENSHVLFYMSSDEKRKVDTSWCIDSGASQHMTNNKELIEQYNEFISPEIVRLGDNREVLAYGKGNVLVKVNSDGGYKSAELVDVLYVPALAKNLFSVSAVTKRGLTMSFERNKCVILNDEGTILGSGKLSGKLFVLDALEMNNKTHIADSAVKEITEELWHQRYGHLNNNSLRVLQNNNLVDGMKFQPSETENKEACDGCMKGKQSRNSFPRDQATRAKEILDLVHSDVCGPMQTKSLGGNRYFVTFIDDKSRYTAIYFMQRKDEVFNKFKEYEAMMMNVTGKKIKTLRSDNGGEYTSKVFSDYLKSQGIQRQFTIPRTPKQNGVAERMNRTIQETARSMIHGAGLSDEFWAEAVLTAVILRNRGPTKAVNDMTPYQCFTGNKPNVSNLRVFGCTAYMHIAKETRKKWDAKSTKCIFIGYCTQSKGYRLWNPETRRVHESRDVIFFERDFDNRVDTPKKHSDPEVIFPSSTDCSDTESENNEQCENEVEIPENADVDEIGNEIEMEEREVLRRSERVRRPPERHGAITGDWWEFAEATYSCADDVMGEPRTLKEALDSSAKSEWKEALDNEYSSLIEHKTWNLVKPPEGRNIVDSRWVFKVKYNADGTIERYKARLVAKGFTQEAGIDFEETFAPVARYTSIRALLAIVNQLDLELDQMDVSTAFLNGDLKEEIFMKQPEGYIQAGKEDLVCKLNKSIYGLKQASRCWYNTIDQFLKDSGYKQCKADSCLYMKRVGASFVYIAVYVDDLLFASNDIQMLSAEKKLLQNRFNTKDLGEAHYCLGIQIQRDRSKKQMLLHQTKYLSNLLKKFGMENCKATATPQEQNTKLSQNEGDSVDKAKYQALIGSLTYAVTATRPDLAQALGSVNQFSSNPGNEHWTAAKRILRYIQGTINHGIRFDGSKEDGVQLKGYVDADWGTNPNGRKSQSGYVFLLCGGIISWSSKKQPIIALSSTEAEYIAATSALQEAMWLRALLNDLNFKQEQPTVINEDNQGAIALCKNPKFHARTKHIDIRYHFIREQIDNLQITLQYCSTEDMIADMLTKPLGKTKFQKFRDLMGVFNSI